MTSDKPLALAHSVRVKVPGGRPQWLQGQASGRDQEAQGKAESAVASVRLKAGRAAIVSLKPKAAYRAKLATAEKVLVKEMLTANGSKRTLFGKLKIVQ